MWTEITTAVGIPLIRSVAGWIISSLKDGKIDEIEWQRLLKTTFEITIMGLGVYFALDKIGLDITVLASTLSVATADMVLSWIKPIFKTNKK